MPEQSEWQLSQCAVGAFLVVNRDPVVSYFPDLIQVFKEVSIEHLMPIGAVKALDKSVLARFSGLDVLEGNTSFEPFQSFGYLTIGQFATPYL